MTRACAHCEQEQGILNRADASKSHGHCHRHFVSVLLADGASQADIDEGISRMSANPFCPDLKLA